MFETTVDDNNVHTLVKIASNIYCAIRMHHLVKRKTEYLKKDYVQNKFTKLVHFYHQ